MVPKTTASSSFHFIFRFSVVDLVDNAKNLENDPLTVFEKFDLKVENIKKYLNELQKFPRLSSYNTLQLLWPSTIVPKFMQIV